MNALDRRIKRERKLIYKEFKKLFKARDMAVKHLTKPIRISQLIDYFTLRGNENFWMSTTDLAHLIVHKQNVIRGIKPPKPPIPKK